MKNCIIFAHYKKIELFVFFMNIITDVGGDYFNKFTTMKKITTILAFLAIHLFIYQNIAFAIPNLDKNCIKVGVYDNSPKIFMNPSQQPDGIFIDIMNEIARKEGFCLEYFYGNWNDLLDMLQKGDIDILPDVAFSKERDSLYSFNKLFILNSWLEVFTLKDQPYNSIFELNHKKIGVLKGSIQEEYLQVGLKSDFNIDYLVFNYDTYEATVKALENKEVDVIIANRFFYFSSMCNENILPTGIILRPSDLFFAFTKNKHNDLIIKIDKQLANFKNDPGSVYYTSIHKWFDKEYHVFFPNYLKWGLIILLFFTIVILLFNFILRKKVRNKTSELIIMNQELLLAKIKAEESDKLKTSFLNNISHEIRTPLNAICGFSELLKEGDSTIKEREKYIEIVQKSSNQLLTILTDIITISSIETNQEEVNFTELNINQLNEALYLLFEREAKKKNLALNYKNGLSDHKSKVFSDKDKIFQILHNLIHNAIKFTKVGTIEFGYQLIEKNIQFYVRDTGIGIEKDDLERIFMKFAQADTKIQAKYGGTGLGIPISKGFAQLLGGDLWVESTPNVGTTFYFSFPYHPSTN